MGHGHCRSAALPEHNPLWTPECWLRPPPTHLVPPHARNPRSSSILTGIACHPACAHLRHRVASLSPCPQEVCTPLMSLRVPHPHRLSRPGTCRFPPPSPHLNPLVRHCLCLGDPPGKCGDCATSPTESHHSLFSITPKGPKTSHLHTRLPGAPPKLSQSSRQASPPSH
jgi:hypothetical protein